MERIDALVSAGEALCIVAAAAWCVHERESEREGWLVQWPAEDCSTADMSRRRSNLLKLARLRQAAGTSAREARLGARKERGGRDRQPACWWFSEILAASAKVVIFPAFAFPPVLAPLGPH